MTMRKFLAPILTVAIVAALAGVLYIRANVRSVGIGDASGSGTAAASDTWLYFSVGSSDSDSDVLAYEVGTGETVDASNYGGGTRGRFSQSSDICGKAGNVVGRQAALTVQCQVDKSSVLRLDVYDDGALVTTATVDPRDEGLFPDGEGYVLPVAAADDKSAIYLGRRVETESWVAGLWRLDVATGEMSEIEYVRERNLYLYEINPATRQLLGVSFTPPESLGADPTGPFALSVVDLDTGEGGQWLDSRYPADMSSADVAVNGFLENPMLSDDAAKFAFYMSGRTYVADVPDGPGASVPLAFEGVMKDWIGDTVVFDRDGNLFLYDLKTETETQITHETDATVEYLGHAR